jgi:dipeptidyl aminopeptidase/acylaminoacyl peptidase
MRTGFRRAAIVCAVACADLLSSGAAAGQTRPCAPLLPLTDGQSRIARPLIIRDLATLRDIGPTFHEDPRKQIFSVSPDGRWVAFQMHRADPDNNRYCVGIFVLPLNMSAAPREVDVSDELPLVTLRRPDRAASPTGIVLDNTPHWSPDGKWLAYLKSVDGVTQVWRAELFGGIATALTHSGVDVDDFRILPSGKSLVYASRPGIAGERAKIAHEGLSGWHFDERWTPIAQSRPFVPDTAPSEAVVLDLASSTVRHANEDEHAIVQQRPQGVPIDGIVFAASGQGSVAWLEYGRTSQLKIHVRRRGHSLESCDVAACRSGVQPAIWWTHEGQKVRFIRREGWGSSLTTVYEWTPGSASLRRIYSTEDALIECKPVGNDLLCLREQSRRPRHLVMFDAEMRRASIVFDPNPAFQSLKLGKVERLNWRNAYGVEAFGDLVYPVGYANGRTYPLIVVQYRTRGFLRGGVGDEFPIQAFANRGYFVLSVENHSYDALVGENADPIAQGKAYNRNFLGRRSLLSSIERAVGSLIDRGLVDPARVGITGLSDGSSTVQFAALHSKLFSAASVSGCCWEQTQDALLGPSAAASFNRSGWPRQIDNDQRFWSEISLAQNPEKVAFPILFQAADDEYIAALESFTALVEAGKPTDMYIFPNEHHIKSQPAHRLAIYQRNLDWFDFWLKGTSPSNAAAPGEAARWLLLRDRKATAP